MSFSKKAVKYWLYVAGALLAFATVGVQTSQATTLKTAPDFSVSEYMKQHPVNHMQRKILSASVSALSVATPINQIFPDSGLAQAVGDNLGMGVTDAVTQSQLDTIYTLDAGGHVVTSLTGLQHLRSLAVLEAYDNYISDLSVFASMPNLMGIDLSGNQVASLNGLKGLQNLRFLSLTGNNISDISVLSSLPNLIMLTISGNNVSSLTALSGLKNLSYIDASSNPIKDFSPLNEIQALQYSQLTDLYYLDTVNYGMPFRDVVGSSFKPDISWVYGVGVTTGTSATTYSPNNNVTRGQMAAFMYRISGEPSFPALKNPFTDVAQFKSQILWLKLLGITTGTSATKYSPNASVTRGQMAAFLHRLAIAQGYAPRHTNYISPFTDAKNGTQFSNDIAWLKTTGITTGTSATTYSPNKNVTRGQMAAFLHRYYNWTNSSTQDGK